MSNPGNTTIQLIVGDVKHTVDLRITAGVKIVDQAPKSTLYTGNLDLKTSADEMKTRNQTLKDANEGYHTALAALELAKGVLLSATDQWDSAFDVFLTLGQKYCTSEADAASLALQVRTSGGKNPLAMPLAVLLSYDPKKLRMRIQVKRAPGMDIVAVEITADPSNPASWKELDGWGAIHFITNPAPGTWWVRAASKTAHAKSEFTTPVSVLVK